MSVKRWATRNLYSGDLTALREIVKGTQKAPQESQIARLQRRRFVALRRDRRPSVTPSGRLALLIRRLPIQF